MIKSDIVVNSCLKEGAVTVSFDSVKYGKPLICINSGGFTRYFEEKGTAIVLPLEASRENQIKLLKNALLKLSNKTFRYEISTKAQTSLVQYNWEYKGLSIYDTFKKLLLNHDVK